ncbi:hypothetical protein DK842_15390 [Chromobacterium phragmitis]|uniref:Methyltransferase domain-containing protein n=1 Tax=Chromobacterium phragmitis TaxID=2202141 RepID=A0A344UMN4_9NEIS|nr:class I SAM-dependent methyltransferase [Chromobacterium phragmitis]AXE31148.1 hypothetical protein DK842_15390 [Chromobacterium phragmitis]AXE36532.1 hypothetical protein DK843_20920 [Chromobacterium phragmitis]
MHYNDETVDTFDRGAARYAEKYGDLRLYDAYFDVLLSALPCGPIKFLDLASGPGGVAAYVRNRRPDAMIVCADRSAAMLSEAAKRVSGALIAEVDCRDLGSIDARFDGAAFFFGLSYLDDMDAAVALRQARKKLLDEGVLLLASVTGDPGLSGAQSNHAGDRVFNFYRTPERVVEMVLTAGFEVLESHIIPSPSNATHPSSDLVLLARRSPGIGAVDM